MADKPTQLLLDALSRAAAEPAGVPLYAGKGAPGLFPATTAARAAAQRCKDDALVRVVRTETHGKSVQELCAITDKGLAFLLRQVSPRQLLEDLVRALEAREAQLAEIGAAARQARDSIEALRGVAAVVLQQLAQQREPPLKLNGTPAGNDWLAAILTHLQQRHSEGAAQDCPLPDLYRVVREHSPGLTIGRFHDGLRELHEQGRIYLHPWTGPLYALPEPPCALLVGHEVAYYASLR